MNIRPLPKQGDDAREIEGDRPYAKYSLTILQPFNGDIFDADGQRLGNLVFEPKVPPTPAAPRRKPAEDVTTTLGQKVAGAIGQAKAEFEFNRASDATIEKRRALCEACEYYDFGRCTERSCKCYCYALVRIASKSCPIGKWSAEGPRGPSQEGEEASR